MDQPFDARLQRAGRVSPADADLERVLNEVVDQARSERTGRRPLRLVSAISLGAALAVGAPVAVAATMQWGPWAVVTEPDIVMARTWVDVEGAPLGSCESRLATVDLPEDARADSLAYFAALDVAAVEPDPDSVAGSLNAVGRLGDIGRLVEHAEPSDFNVSHQGALWDADVYTDARILQEAMVRTITRGMMASVSPANPGVFEAGVTMALETQCTPAPGSTQP